MCYRFRFDSWPSISLSFFATLLPVALSEIRYVRLPFISSFIVISPNTLDKLLDILQDAGLITMKEEMKGRRTYLISLSATGRRVAKKLKEIDGQLSRRKR